MKKIKIKTDENYESNLKLSLPVKSKKAILQVCSTPLVFGLYKLYRLKQWVDAAISEIESEGKK
jgi:RNase P subunit RPR2